MSSRASCADARGRVLLARRTEGRDLAGAWEFPGGKVEPGETPMQALDARAATKNSASASTAIEPLISVPQAYRDKRIVLDVYRVTRYSGKPRGLEQQALAWSPPDKLQHLSDAAGRPAGGRGADAAGALPDHPRARRRPTSPSLPRSSARWHGGMRRVQLRMPTWTRPSALALAAEVKQRCDQAGASCWSTATSSWRDAGLRRAPEGSAADGARRRPLPRATCPSRPSCHDAAELRAGRGAGPGFRGARPGGRDAHASGARADGLGGLRGAARAVSLPIYALGGMLADDHDMARRHGAQGVAGIRGLWPT